MTYEEPITAACEAVDHAPQLPAVSSTQSAQLAAFYHDATEALHKTRDTFLVKDFIDRSLAMGAIARQIHKDRKGEIALAQVHMCSLRRLGQLLEDKRDSGEMNKGGRRKPGFAETRFTLAELDIDKNLANKARRAAQWSDDDFKSKVLPEIEDKINNRGMRKTADKRVAATPGRKGAKLPELQQLDAATTRAIGHLDAIKVKTGSEKQIANATVHVRMIIKMLTDWIDANAPAVGV